MALRVVGAGLGRTGTNSLKVALERLLSGRCYHMMEVFSRLDDIPVWQRAAQGEPPQDWNAFLAEFVATVDWPAAAFWRELSAANPDALVLLSVRDVEGWWRSVTSTIFSDELLSSLPGEFPPDWPHGLITRTFTRNWRDEAEAKAAYLRHNQMVRDTAPPSRLLEWHPGDGWEPLCRALDLPVPDEPFPHLNSTADFRAMAGLDAAGEARPAR